ncbi:MAG: SpoIID/LytB domain-containing protein [Nannocystaceae bacterium]|nr:SpoIID/LytB domain-containing protein [Nannocystaceae bacterium]
MRLLGFAGGIAFACALVVGCDTPASGPGRNASRDAEIPLTAPPRTMQVSAPLPTAYCDVNVTGTGVIDLEEVYLPGVVTCENGGADLEALKAQAISARSVAYYNMATEGEICDSQGCQVFSCGADPSALAVQAVQETSGMYLMYNSTLTYGFYVAGDNNTSGAGCVGSSGSTEQWVTYNSGQSGTNVEQTELGFVHPTGDPSYGQNRGCMGQWGARCLEEGGAGYLDILRFYYGEDIEIVQAEGDCVLPGETTDGSDSESSTGGGDPSTSGASMDPSGDSTDPSDGSTGLGGGTGPGGDTGKPGGEDSDDSQDSANPIGTETAGESALPGGFGEDATNSGCNCTSRVSDSRGGFAAGLGMLLLGLGRRRKRCLSGTSA